MHIFHQAHILYIVLADVKIEITIGPLINLRFYIVLADVKIEITIDPLIDLGLVKYNSLLSML